MTLRILALSAAAACALTFGAVNASAGVTTYDFSSASGSSTPDSIGIASFSSPGDPGAFTFGPNGGLFSNLGSTVLSSNGNVETLDITFSAPQDQIHFNFGLGDFFAGMLSGPDTLTLTTNNGQTQTESAVIDPADLLYPSGSLTLSSPTEAFTSVTITSAYPIVLADLFTVPEPASMAVLGAGLVGLAAARRRRA